MTEAKKILELIESVDPADSAALDEIDVLSHIFAKNWECDGVVNIKANDRGSGGIDYYLKDNNHAFGGQNLHLKLKYTRSRDALKSIRPEGFWCEFKKADDGDWVGILGKNGGSGGNICKFMSGYRPTEELAELHAIIQAIEYNRGQE